MTAEERALLIELAKSVIENENANAGEYAPSDTAEKLRGLLEKVEGP